MGKKKKNRVKIGLFIILLAAAGFGLLYYITALRDSMPAMAYTAAYTEITKEDIADSLSLKGTVESVEKRKIYSSSGYKINRVNVKTGDHVDPGQTLAELDTMLLELDITGRKADLSNTQKGALLQLENSQRLYNEMNMNLNNGTNSQITNADSALKAAEAGLNTAQQNYDTALNDYNLGANNEANTQIMNAESALKTAKVNLNSAQKNYEDALNDFENNQDGRISGAESVLKSAELDLSVKEEAYENAKILKEVDGVSEQDVRNAENAYTSAQSRYNDAVVSLDNAKLAQRRSLEQAESSLQSARTNYDNALAVLNTVKTNAQQNLQRTLEQAENALNSARTSYDNASAALNTANVNTRQDLEKLESGVESAQILTNLDSQIIAIQKLEKQLQDAIITSPISGTVTAVYASEGSPGTGLLFVVEDADNLKITTKIKEYDVGRVQPGMAVLIKSDLTGDSVYRGIVSNIDPAAAKNTSGDTNTVSGIEFNAEILLTEYSGLRIGLEARLTIEIEKKNDVYKVTNNAVLFEADGSASVFIAEENGSGQFVAAKIQIETGMKTDSYIEIRGDALYEGMRVLDDASLAWDGMYLAL